MLNDNIMGWWELDLHEIDVRVIMEKLGVVDVAGLVGALNDDDVVIRKVAATALGKFKDPVAVLVAVPFAVPFAAEGLTNGMLEPWLIGRTGAPAPTFFGAELAGSLVAMAAIGCLLAVPRWKRADPAKLLVVLLPMAAWYYIAAGWLSPDLGWYLAWNTVQFSVTMLVGVALDHMLMDAVRGERRGTAFQAYGLAVQAGSLAGTFLGPLVAAGVGMEGVLLLAAGLLVATGVAYGAWLRPALRKAVRREAAMAPGSALYPVPGW